MKKSKKQTNKINTPWYKEYKDVPSHLEYPNSTMINYLEEKGIKVYSPRSEMFFARKEVKEALGCMILCFPDYVVKLRNRTFKFDAPELYDYFEKDCVAAAKDLIVSIEIP